MKERNAIIIVFTLVLLFIPLVFLIIVIPSEKEKSLSSSSPPTPTLGSRNMIVTPGSENKQNEFLEYVKNRKSLSESDAAVKKQILTLLPSEEDSGVLHQTPAISIEYIHEPDLFQVEILTTDIQSAKKEANTWFREKGMSQEGICYLPVQFYINYAVAKTIPNAADTFNPLAPDC